MLIEENKIGAPCGIGLFGCQIIPQCSEPKIRLLNPFNVGILGDWNISGTIIVHIVAIVSH
ncbi:hypothetical protein D3C72_2383410 [compost metagenome]